MIYKTASPRPDHVRVIFELPASLWAHQVYLAGKLNGGDSQRTPFLQDRKGVWQAMVDLPKGKSYAFHYIIDGRWQTDSRAEGFTTSASGVQYNIVQATLPLAEATAF